MEEHFRAAQVNNGDSRAAFKLITRGITMSEDQGATKGQGKSDANVKADAAIPANPAVLSDKELEKVAGGARIAGPTSNDVGLAFRLPNTSFTRNK